MGECFFWGGATKVEKSYDYFSTLPLDNKTLQVFKNFQKKFNEDGNNIVVGIERKDFFLLDVFKAFVLLEKNISKIRGVESTLSVGDAVFFERNDEEKKFLVRRVFSEELGDQRVWMRR